MLHVHIVASHPHKESLTLGVAQTIAGSIKSECEVRFSYLDEMQYNPLLSTEEIARRASFDEQTIYFQKSIKNTNILVMCYPDWWGFPPARLVGWLQRVFSAGVAFSYDEKKQNVFELQKNLSHLHILHVVSSNEKESTNIEKGIALLQERLLRHAGVQNYTQCILTHTRESSASQKDAWIHKAISLVKKAKNEICTN